MAWGAGGPRSPGDPLACSAPARGTAAWRGLFRTPALAGVCRGSRAPSHCHCLSLSLPTRPPVSAQLEVLHYRLSVCSALHSPAHPSLQALHAHQVLAAQVLSAPPAPWHKPRSSRLCSSEAWGRLGLCRGPFQAEPGPPAGVRGAARWPGVMPGPAGCAGVTGCRAQL